MRLRLPILFSLACLAAGCGGGAPPPAASPATPANTAKAPANTAKAPAVQPTAAPKAAAQAKENAGRVRDIQAKCAETTEEGKAVLEKAQAWKPVVNQREADRPLKEVAADFASKGIYDICWSATKKQSGRWKVGYNYIDLGGGFKEAEWEYDPQSGEIKPFNNDAVTFWTGKI